MNVRTSDFLLGSLVEAERRAAIERVLRAANSMILNQHTNVRFVDSRNAPAGAVGWTDGVTAFFNADRIGTLTSEGLEAMQGLNGHECAHIAYTPRAGSLIYRTVMAEGLSQEFNMLEDQRIETFYGNRFPSVKTWYIAMISRYLVANEKFIPLVFPLLWGRRYLPQSLRDSARSAYAAQEHVDEIAAIIDEYRTLVFPTSQDRGIELIRQFHRVMNDVREQMEEEGNGDAGEGMPDPFGHGAQDPPMDKGRPEDVDSQREAVEQERQQEERRQQGEEDVNLDPGKAEAAEAGDGDDEPEGAADLDAQGDEAGGDQTDGQTDGQGDDDGDGQSDAKADSGAEGDSPDDAQGNAASRGGDIDPGASKSDKAATDDAAGQQEHEQPSDDVLAQALDLLSRVTSDASYRTEVDRLRNQVLRAEAGDVLPVGDWTTEPAEEGIQGYRTFSRVLKRIQQQVEMGYDRRTDVGKVNVVRYALEGNREEAFDLWDEGQADALDIECVVLYDFSSSMGVKMKPTLQSAWAIKRAMDEIGATVSVIGYNQSAQWLYKPGERAERTAIRYHRADGQTRPNAAVSQALRIFAATKRTLKILVVLTDGEWADGQLYGHDQHCDAMIERMGKAGVVTALGFLATDTEIVRFKERFSKDKGGPETWEEAVRHSCQVFTHLHTPGQLTEFASAIITNAIRRRLAKR